MNIFFCLTWLLLITIIRFISYSRPVSPLFAWRLRPTWRHSLTTAALQHPHKRWLRSWLYVRLYILPFFSFWLVLIECCRFLWIKVYVRLKSWESNDIIFMFVRKKSYYLRFRVFLYNWMKQFLVCKPRLFSVSSVLLAVFGRCDFLM